MRMVVRNPEEKATGIGSGGHIPDNDFKTQISQALALKLNLKTQQHANERMFRRMVVTGGSCSSLKQAIQARAAVYSQDSDASWYVKNYDIGGRARTLKQRRIVRSHLASAPLLIAQTALQYARATLDSGNDSALEQVRLGDQVSVMQMLKMLSIARPMTVLRLLDKVKAQELGHRMSQISRDLDFVQTILDLASQSDELNPPLNAVAEAFRRRHLEGTFATDSHSVKMDALLFADTKSVNDSDLKATEVNVSSTKRKSTTTRAKSNKLPCYAFQRGNCTCEACRFDHRHILFGSGTHGEAGCPKNRVRRARSPASVDG